MPDFHRLNKSRTVEMSKEELKEKLREETERSQKAAAKKKKKAAPPPEKSKKQQKIAEKTKNQHPPQSPVRKKREQEAKQRAIQEEKQKQKKKRRRRGSNVVYYVMLSLLAAIIFSILSVTVLFNTEHIVIEGESQYTEEEIIAASGLSGDENLVRLNLSGIPDRILDRLVSLDSVSIRKEFPNTIKITVSPSIPMASFLYGGKYYVISHSGRVMSIDSSAPDCMRVIGYKPSETVTVGAFIKAENEDQDRILKDISSAIEGAEIEGINTVNIYDNLDIVLTYDNRIEIRLGSILQLDEKVRIIRELLFNGHIAETEYVTLDVSDITKVYQRPITTTAASTTPPQEEPDEEEPDENSETTA